MAAMKSKFEEVVAHTKCDAELLRFDTKRLVGWLSTHPSMNEICHRFVTDFFTEYDLYQVRIVWIAENDDIEVIGEYGFRQSSKIDLPTPANSDALLGMVLPSVIWRNDPSELTQIALNRTGSNWTADGKSYVMHLTQANMSIGIITFTSHTPGKYEQSAVEMRFKPIIQILSLYLSLERRVLNLENTVLRMKEIVVHERSDLDMRINLLTDRQLRIVRLMAHNKANAQIADELGYSLSTIHSDSIDIYRILGVNSRRGAVDAIRARLDAEMDEMKDQ